MRFRLTLLIVVMLFGLILSVGIVDGQTTDPTPIISPENATNLVPVSIIESPYLGDMVWSPDGTLLAVGTSHDGVQIFQSANLSAPPSILAGGADILFHPSSTQLASAGAVWDIETQQEVFIYGEADYRAFTPDGRFLFTAKQDDEHTDFTFWEMSTGDVAQTFTIDTPPAFKQVIFDSNSDRYGLIFQTADSYYEGESYIQIREILAETILARFPVEWVPEDVVFANEGRYFVADTVSRDMFSNWSNTIIWDIESQSRLIEFESYDLDARLSPNGKQMFVDNNDGSYVFDLDSAQATPLVTGSLQIDRGNPVFSIDGHYLGFSYSQFRGDVSDYGVAIWSIDQMANSGEPIKTYVVNTTMGGSGLYDFNFSPDGLTLAMSIEEQIVLWDVESESIQHTFEAQGKVSFTPDGQYLIVQAFNNRTAQVWDISSGTRMSRIENYDGVSSPSGTQLARLTADGLRVVDIVSGDETVIPVLDDYLGRVALFDAENELVVFQDEGLHVRHLHEDLNLLGLDTVDNGHFVVSPDGSRIVVWTTQLETLDEVRITVYPLDDVQAEPVSLEGMVSSARLSPVTISPDSRYVLAIEGTYAEETRQFGIHTILFDAETGENLVEWNQADSWLLMPMFSPDSQYIIISGTDPFDRNFVFDVFEVSTLISQNDPVAMSSVTLAAGNSPVFLDIGFSPDGNQVIMTIDDALLGDGVVHGYQTFIFDWTAFLTNGGENIESVSLRGAYSSVLNSDGTLVASSVSNYDWRGGTNTYLWNALTGEEIVQLEGYFRSVFSPDGRLLMALSRELDMVLWDLETLIQGDLTPLAVYESPADIRGISFSPAGDYIYQRTTYSIITLTVRP